MTRKPTKEPTHQRPAKRTAKKPVAKKPPARNGQTQVIVIEPPPPASSLRGILPTPPEVAKLLAEELEGHPVTAGEKQRLTDCFKLQYYFGGHWILYRQTDQGKEVLAVDMEEIGRALRRRMPAAERETLVLGHPEIWQASERSDFR